MKKKVVFVGLSGGVDSAVSATLLKKAGYEVVGVFIKTWHPSFLVCHEEEERRDAMRVAAYLDIPFLTFDFENVYKKEVADYMIREYKMGRTPNPDVMCNKEVKFGAFLKKALAMGADCVATGHYAQVGEAGNYFFSGPRFSGSLPRPDHVKKYFQLRQSPDHTKDQSYFLWTLTQEQLSKIIFPVGNFKKKEVRKLAKKFGLPVAEKKDSQGICFLGSVDLKEFLKHYIKPKKGEVVFVPSEVEGGGKKVIGWHSGVVFSTLGERHGFTITKKSPNDGRYYIIGKDIKKNILTVSSRQDLVQHNSTILTNYRIENVNWITKIPDGEKTYTAQIRYHGELLLCKVKIVRQDLTTVIFQKPVLVASGQSCVLYDDDICLGGGVVK